MSKRGKADEQAARKERLSAALRENLKRRKQQARDRATDRAGLGQAGLGQAGLGQAGLGQAMPGEVSQEDPRAAEPVTDFRRNPGDE